MCFEKALASLIVVNFIILVFYKKIQLIEKLYLTPSEIIEIVSGEKYEESCQTQPIALNPTITYCLLNQQVGIYYNIKKKKN